MDVDDDNTPAGEDDGAAGSGKPPGDAPAGDGGNTGNAHQGNDWAAREQEIRAQAWAQARRHYEQKSKPRKQQQRQPTPTQPAPDGPSNSDVLSELRMLRTERAFDEALPDGLTLDKAQRQRMRKLFVQENPEDQAGWCNDFITTFNLSAKKAADDETGMSDKGSAANSNGVRSENGTGQARQKFPIDAGAPAPGATSDGAISDVRQLTAEARERLIARHGVQKANRIIRDMVTAQIRRST